MNKIEIKSKNNKRTINANSVWDYNDLLNIREFASLIQAALTPKDIMFFLNSNKNFLYKQYKDTFISLRKIK